MNSCPLDFLPYFYFLWIPPLHFENIDLPPRASEGYYGTRSKIKLECMYDIQVGVLTNTYCCDLYYSVVVRLAREIKHLCTPRVCIPTT